MLVTGASGGVGLGAATELIGWGHEVVLHGRTSARFDGIGIARSALGILHGDLSIGPCT